MMTILANYRLCQGGSFELSKNPLDKMDNGLMLAQLQMGELDYFFIQHSLPKQALEYPEEL